MRATKMVPQLEKCSYEARFRWLNPPKQKIERGMIQVYNIVSGKDNNRPTVKWNSSHISKTRSNLYKMQLTHMHYNLR